MTCSSTSRARSHRLFDGCHAVLVWLVALACITREPLYRDLALAAMAAIALVAALAALFPALVPLPKAEHAAPPPPAPEQTDDVL
ncbi:hypothetical protein GGQ88_003620 [Novosphingobium hassiacum]|uniref:Uncharacterized protein n=1 Tax=Novosphingobium hassiacum TaxID=173676 RepID=A0A7W6A2Y9_9SPHN|nr:hypothetical protein [Novosphingobium hassiacum]